MKYLVIGSEGFLGKEVCRVLREQKDCFLIKVDCVKPFQGGELTSCHQIKLSEQGLLLDICKSERVDVVFNLAGVSAGAVRKDLFEVNCFSSISFLEAMAGMQCRIILVGSAAEYGAITPGVKVKEGAPLSPVSDYGVSKACQTFMALERARKNAFPQVIIARPFNIVGRGIGNHLSLGSFSMQIARIEKGMQPPVLRAGNLKSVRDFMPLNEFARCLKELAMCGKHGEVYNICSGKPHEIGKILEKLISLSKTKIEVDVDPERFKPDDIPWVIGDNTKLEKICRVLFSEDKLLQALGDALSGYREEVGKHGR